MPPTQHLKALRISPANTVTNHVATSIVSDTGSIAGVGSSLLWVKHGYINSAAEIIATPPDTAIGRSHGSFKHLKHSGGTTVSSRGTLHNVTMDGSRDWLVRSSTMIFHSGLSIGSSPKQLSNLHFDLVSGRGNFFINSYNAQITEVPAGQSFYVDKTSLLAVEYDQNTAFEIVGNKPYTPALKNSKDTLDVSPVTSILETTEIPRDDLPETKQHKQADNATENKPSAKPTTLQYQVPDSQVAEPHYYLYNNRWWITTSKLSRKLVRSIASIPSSLVNMFRRSSKKAAIAAKNAAKSAVTFSKKPPNGHPDSTEAPTSIPRPSLVARIKTFIGSYTNPSPFQTFVHIRGPTKVVVGQMHMPKVTTQANDIEPYITEPELPAPVAFAPQTHDYLKIAEVINGRVVFRSVPNFSTYNGVNGQ
ncbi:hypothetical protein B0I73DRAFT_128819 [Yarrowia lipolytica]|nr:hypothetical protein B0I73DRAFT_128819 [Yarrowia lipolytica]RDW48489.1 hypothetical protein B0I74DRAFT_133576 [Yarrowia lipolytica]RDW54621.1 hypothetical protein B0I75DRAFT_134338 [Yarrowia lipolytica]